MGANSSISALSPNGPGLNDRGADDFSRFVRPGQIHSGIYTRPDIFEAELARIFHRTWLYIGHETEVPNEGDFKLRSMGRQPVIMIRDGSGRVNVFLNRCRHRGALVAEVECGQAKFLKCWWHGWVYGSDGKLLEVPKADAYEPGFAERIGGLRSPGHVASYRGFVFAALDADVVSLQEHFGRALDMVDLLCDASPTGGITVRSGVNKNVYHGNWKFVGMDGYHVDTVHASVLAVWRQKQDTGIGATHRGDPTGKDSVAVTRAFGRGNVMIDYRAYRVRYLDAHLAYLRKMEGGAEYIAAMQAKHGETRGNELLAVAGDPHLGLYPNMQIINNQIRIINPIAVDETQLLIMPVMLDGVPPQINETRLRHHETFYGAAGAGAPDDAEMFERAQRGLHAEVDPWIDVSRGMHREEVDPEDASIYGAITDEVPQRDQMREWLRLMTRA